MKKCLRPSASELSLEKLMRACEYFPAFIKYCIREKIVNEVELSSFTPLVFSPTGGMAREATVFLKAPGINAVRKVGSALHLVGLGLLLDSHSGINVYEKKNFLLTLLPSCFCLLLTFPCLVYFPVLITCSTYCAHSRVRRVDRADVVPCALTPFNTLS